MRRALLLILAAVLPAVAQAQSSQFGVRGLGQPGRGVSARSAGTSWAMTLFDGESSLNPAALDGATALTASFTGVQSFRSADNPAGSESLRETRFPLFALVAPVRRYPVVLSVSYSSYMNRDFTLVRADSLLIRGESVGVNDTLASRGGISDLRLAGSYRLGPGWSLGGAFHILTGSNRFSLDRSFADDTYQPVSQRTELSYSGVGASIGTVGQLGKSLTVAALARTDGHLSVDRDSSRAGQVDLPYTFGLGLRWQAGPRLQLATHGLYRTWSAANSDLVTLGGPGARNTIEVTLGGEYVDPRRPYHRPLRFGARYGTLPFPIGDGPLARELAASLGSGTRFAQQRGGLDLAVEYFRRSADEFTESGFLVTVGVSVRP